MLQVDPRVPKAPSEFVASLEEFQRRYSLHVDQGIIQIVDRTSNLVIARLTTPTEKQCKSYYAPHFYEGNYYFVLTSERYPVKYVYSFNLQDTSIKCIFSPSHHPHFFESRLIEFGTGFNTPGPQRSFRSGQGVIKVYDLTQRPLKEVNHIVIEGGGGYGWDGEIDKEEREITAFCHVKGTTHRFPIFNKV